MVVVLKLSGPLRAFYCADPAPKEETAALPAGSKVADLLDDYRIPHDKAHHVMVNRQRATLDTELADGDQVWIIPLAAGG